MNWVRVMDNGALELMVLTMVSCVLEEVVDVVWGCVSVWIVALLELDVAELTALPFGEFCPNFDLIPNDLQLYMGRVALFLKSSNTDYL